VAFLRARPAFRLAGRRLGVQGLLPRRRGRVVQHRDLQLRLQLGDTPLLLGQEPVLLGDTLGCRQERQADHYRAQLSQRLGLRVGKLPGQRRSHKLPRLSIRADSAFHTPCIHHCPQKRKSE